MNFPLHELMPVGYVQDLARSSRARLLAQEWVRNGFNLSAAYRTVLHREPKWRKNGVAKLYHEMDEFVDELGILLKDARIDKTQVLNILWSMLHASILDYFDENGRILSITELKRLPRTMQMLIHKLKVHRTEEPVRDKDGNVMLDDMGKPQLTCTTRVEIEVPEKIVAIQQLAAMMRWTGPVMVANINVNLGILMAELDDKRKLLELSYGDT